MCFLYNDVIMTMMASKYNSLTVVYLIVHLGADQRKHQSSASLASVRGIHQDRWIPTQNVSIWWRHHVLCLSYQFIEGFMVLFISMATAVIAKSIGLVNQYQITMTHNKARCTVFLFHAHQNALLRQSDNANKNETLENSFHKQLTRSPQISRYKVIQ